MLLVWTHLFPDLQGSLAQRLRLLVLASLPVQDGQVVEGGSNLPGAQASSQHVCERVSTPAQEGQEVISTSPNLKPNSTPSPQNM